MKQKLAPVMPTLAEPFIGVVKRKFPFAIEIEPKTACKLWPRIFGAGHLFFNQRHNVQFYEFNSMTQSSALIAVIVGVNLVAR